MKTYNTYQEAKIANPDGKVYESIGGKFAVESDVSHIALCGCNQGWNECNPSDYCMTVEGFLDAGHLFVDGDLYINYRSRVCEVGEFGHSPEACNISGNIAYNRDAYILRAAALEKPKCTKVEYELIKFESTAGAYRAMLDGEKLYGQDGESEFIFDGKNFVGIDSDGGVYTLECHSDNEPFYRRIETPMTEREAMHHALNEITDCGQNFMSVSELFDLVVDSGKFKLVN